MKIGLNGQMLLIDKFAGPEVYTYNVFKNLALLDKTNQYIIYFSKEPSVEFWEKLTNKNHNFTFKVLQKKISWTHYSLMTELLKNPPDIFFTAVHTIPFIHSPKTKIISMIHGLEYKINKQYEKNSIKYYLHPIILWWVLTFSKIIIVPSLATKNAILENNFWHFDSKKIKIVSEGVDNKFYKTSADETRNVLEKYNINYDKYLIFVSTIQPRKNIPIMINAFANVIKNNEAFKNTGLIICGKQGWMYHESINAPKKFNIEENIRFLGRVPDDDLPKLLSGAQYFISLSLEEGFGIPLLEAMACQIPAIVSDIPSFKEIGEDTQTYVDPANLDEITKTISQSLQNKNSEKIQKAYELSKNYTWEKTASELIYIFESISKN